MYKEKENNIEREKHFDERIVENGQATLKSKN